MINNFFKINPKDIPELALKARKALEAKGMVQAYPVFGWIEKEWLEKALNEGVIRYHSKEYGYIIVANKRRDEKVVGYRGRTPITETKDVIDTSAFQDFLRRYQEYREKKEKTQYAINKDIQEIIAYNTNKS
jgi:hypothetical protein